MADILNSARTILVIALLILVIPKVLLPYHLGEFLAKMEIGYEETWQEYIEDCDCTENLE